MLDFRVAVGFEVDRHPRASSPDRVLVQWLTGGGPMPRMFDDNGAVLYRHEIALPLMGWVPVKNSYGWDIFDAVKS